MNPLGLAALGGALWWLSRLNRNPDGAGFRDKNGRFHPIRSSEWYQPSLLDHPEPTRPSASAERPAATKGEAIKVAQDALTRHDAVITRTKGEALWIRGRREAMQAPAAAPAPVTPEKAPDWLDGEDRPRRPLETRRVRNGGFPVRPPNDLVTTYKIVKARNGSFIATERSTTSKYRPDENSRQYIFYLDDDGTGRVTLNYDRRGNTPMPPVAAFPSRREAEQWMTKLTEDLSVISQDHSPSEDDERHFIQAYIARLVPHQRAKPAETNRERQEASVRERAEEAKRLADLIADPAKAQGIDVGDMVHAIYTANYKRYEVQGVITKRLTSSWKVRPIQVRQFKYRAGLASPRFNYKPYQGAKDMTLPGKTDKGWTQNNGITGKTFITPAAKVTR